MEREDLQQRTIKSYVSFRLKHSAILLLLLLSVLIIACDAGKTTTTVALDEPHVTLTIQFNNHVSPIPTVAPYLCGAWITNTTQAFHPGNTIPVYAHFIHNVDGNPVGVSGASAQASVEWADGSTDTQMGITQSDGLAVFYFTIPNRLSMVDKNNLVLVSFTGPHDETCTIDNQPQPAAYFTLSKETPNPKASPSAIPSKKHKKHGLLIDGL